VTGFEVCLDKDLGSGAVGHAAIPDGAQRGMVVIHELLGRQPEIDRVVERFARAGYAAIAPDLFGKTPRAICIARAVRAMSRGDGPMVDRALRARAWLCARAGLDEKRVGLIGFCFGGGFVLAAGGGWGAVSTNYGAIPPDALLSRLPPTIGCYGARDRIFGALGPALERRLGALGVACETHTFDGVGHSFLTDGHHPIGYGASNPLLQISYHPEVAEEGWRRILAFFDRHL
jgi:carboxymethylenebutenolidase